MAKQKTSDPIMHVPDGEWIDEQGGILLCCDCCLAHKVEYRLLEGKLQIKLTRDEKETAKERKKFAKRCIVIDTK